MTDPHALAAQLDEDYQSVLEDLIPTDTALILEWQKTTRLYQRIQDYLRHGYGDPRAQASADQLADLIDRGHTRRPITAWRGVRSVGATFGNPPPQVGDTYRFIGLVAASLDRHIAITEFTTPAGPGGAALFCLDIPIGTPSLWVAAAGNPAFRYQYELLLLSGTMATITAIEYAGTIPTISMRVGA